MQKLKVLVADDEDVIRDLFSRILLSQGYEVSTAHDGREALDEIGRNTFDMLIMDLKMPRMGGMEVLEALKNSRKNLIIIVVTGYATIDTAKEAIKNGCFDYITKPFDVEEMSNIIKRAFELKQLAEEKEKLQAQLEKTRRFALLAEMGAGVTHEVNTVLTSIKLFLEMLRPKLAQPESEKGNVDLVLEEVERAEKLIRRFLDFTKPAELEILETDINNVIRKSLQLFKYKLDKQKIEVKDTLSQDMPGVFCDPALMEEVFLNIVSNSIDAMGEGGALTVSSEISEEKAVITISDTGKGIPFENLSKLYDPFFTTKSYGTGLGLSIVHRIVAEHKGIVKVESEENNGTAIRIELPIF